MFLVRALHRCGIEARLQSGQPPKKAPGIAGEDCGLFTAEGWVGHAWVDITADQFGHAPVVVLPAADTTYRPARDEAYTLTATKNGMAAIDEIWPSWCSYVDQRCPLMGGEPGLL
jgi:hypothetical protein